MSPIESGILGILALGILIAAGVHIGIALGIVGVFGCIAIVGFNAAVSMATTTIYYSATLWTLLAVPLFILMGFLAAGGGISGKLYDTIRLWVGNFTGGLGIATVLGCAAFGTVTGSSVVASSVFAKIAAPEMVRLGYDKKLAYGLCASAGAIGMLIPPSILAIVYAMLAGLSVAELLIAGIGPGLLLTVVFSIGIYTIGKVKPHLIVTPSIGKVSWRERFGKLPSIWPVLVVAVILVGGIFSGVFSPEEAASIATFVIFVIFLFVSGDKRKESLFPAFRDTANTTAMIFLILTGAAVFSRFLVLSGLSDTVLNLLMGLHISKFFLVCLFGVVYLILGCFIDSVSMLAITIPVIQPVILANHIDPIGFAMMAIFSTQIGTITPPVGICVYATKAVAPPEVSLEDVFSGTFPFLIMELLVLVLIIAFPIISTGLVRLLPH